MNRKGFTLIEVLIASGILVLATGAILRISQVAVQSQDYSLEQIRAYRLIEEGFEIVHQMRDTIRIDQTVNTWDEYFPANGAELAPIWDNSTNRWVLEVATEGSDAEIFDGVTYQRTIRFSDLPDGFLPVETESGQALTAADLASSGRKVTVRVSWKSSGTDQEISLDSLITDW